VKIFSKYILWLVKSIFRIKALCFMSSIDTFCFYLVHASSDEFLGLVLNFYAEILQILGSLGRSLGGEGEGSETERL
jgi:hypothetical protein